MEAKVSRFEFVQPWEDQWGYRHNAQMADADEGEFVWYSDYAALAIERDDYKSGYESSEQFRKSLEREREGLRVALEMQSEQQADDLIRRDELTVALEAAIKKLSPETVTKASDLLNNPATD